MRILFLSRWYPYPPNNGSKIRVYNLLDQLARHHEVALISFIDPGEQKRGRAEFQPENLRKIETVVFRSFQPQDLKARLGFLRLTPRAYYDTYSEEMARCIRKTLRDDKYQAIIASQIDTAGYASSFSGLPALFEEVEVGFLYEQFAMASKATRRLRYRLTWAKHKRYLRRLLKHYQASTVVSTRERELLQQVISGPRTVEVIPNCVRMGDYRSTPKKVIPGRMIFSGSFSYRPNYEAMRWFLESVYPQILEQVPGAHLLITGDHQNLQLPQMPNVTLTGYVQDINSLVASAEVSLAPIWSGGGTRLKILEAMALRTPVVSTSKGAEGLEAVDGEHLLIGNTPETFAQKVIQLMTEPDLRDAIRSGAYDLVDKMYNWDVVAPRFLHLVETIAKS